MRRRGRVLVTAVVTAALVAPVVLDADSFPLSTYPMYSRARTTEVGFVTAHAVDASGATSRLSLGTIGSSDDPLIVAGELRAAISAGRAEERCRQIAERADSPRDDDRAAIEIVTELHDVVALATGDESLLDRTVHARCEVGP